MRRYDCRFLSVEDYRQLRKLIKKQKVAAVLTVTPTDEWPRVWRYSDGLTLRLRYYSIN